MVLTAGTVWETEGGRDYRKSKGSGVKLDRIAVIEKLTECIISYG